MSDSIGEQALYQGFKRVEGLAALNSAVTMQDGDKMESTRYEGGVGKCKLYCLEKSEAMSKAENFSLSLDIGLKGVLGLNAGIDTSESKKVTNWQDSNSVTPSPRINDQIV